MILIYNPSHDAAYNLAFEEYALTAMQQDIIMLWRNENAIIVGKNQNALEEIDMEYVREKDITVIRRQSGGGAVFHDLGNINFTVIHALGENDFHDYRKFTDPVIAFLKTLGVAAELSGRNDLLIDGMKFSGNAQAVKKGRIMHHGTLLFSADFTRLAACLQPHPAKFTSKGIKSVRSRVTNISDHLPVSMTVEAFLAQLYAYYLAHTPELEPYAISPQDDQCVRTLVAEKYGLWSWNFGQSPTYDYQNAIAFPCGVVDLRIRAEAGIIRDATIYGDFFGMKDKAGLEQQLVGVCHEKECVRAALAGVDLSQYIAGMTADDFLQLIE